MFIPIPVLIVAVVLGLVVFGLMRLKPREGGPDPLEDAGAYLKGRSGGLQAPAGVETQARTLLERGDKIGAIKLVRDATGLGLKEAKDFVEGL